MRDVRLGRGLRAIRVNSRRRQIDVAALAGVSQQTVSRAELGTIDEMSIGSLRRIAAALGARLDVQLGWRGASLDRLVDERHAHIVGATIDRFARPAWEVVPEASYSRYGERGSIDVLGINRNAGTIIVVEVKTEIGSVEATIRKHDEKVRIAAAIAIERFGVRPRHVAKLLVLPADSTPRRQIARHAIVFDQAYPLRGAAVSAWLRNPSGPMAGLIFLSVTHLASPRRVRVRSFRTRTPGPGPTEHENRTVMASQCLRVVPDGRSTGPRPAEHQRGG
jgi:transcriptional regulator with XRE-family HTH domain